MSISGDVHDCKLARCDPDDIRNNSKNFAKSSESLRREGIEKRGSEEPLQSVPLLCFQEKASTYGLDRRGCLTSTTNYAAGTGTCTQGDMTIPSYPSSEMHLENSPTTRSFRPGL